MIKKILVIYIIVINVIGFFIMGLDKEKAKKNHWRIKERTMFMTAFLGGAAGVISGMKIFHHKTKKPSFEFGIPILLILNIALFIYIYYGFLNAQGMVMHFPHTSQSSRSA